MHADRLGRLAADRSAAERCPCANDGELSHAWNDSSSFHRVTTSQVVRSSTGLSSSNPSNPAWSSTAPARAANRRASSSPLSAGTVIALIFTTVIPSIMPGRIYARPATPACMDVVNMGRLTCVVAAKLGYGMATR